MIKVAAAAALLVFGTSAGWAQDVQRSSSRQAAGAQTAQTQAARADVPEVEALPGTVVRWSVPGTLRCGMGERSWKALQETCYYSIDLARKPGVLRVSRHGKSSVAYARISVTAADYGSEKIVLGDIPQAHPSPADLRRNTGEQARLARLWRRPDGPARFTLPLAAPTAPLPNGTGFGALWLFNTTPESSEVHSGTDYELTVGTPVKGAADGTVVMADDLFFAGNSVFLDHGDGLITMYFHLSEIRVRVGERVERGAVLGLVGQTGRVTGPHLHLAARWHGARIDPQQLLNDPAKMRAIPEK